MKSAHGEPLALAAFSPFSQIRARIWSWNPEQVIDRAFLKSLLVSALQRRQRLTEKLPEDAALRLVHAESDGLPGLIVDRYADTLVVQFLSAGSEFWRDDLVALLLELTGAALVYERSDVDVRSLEGLPLRKGLLHGDRPPDKVQINENGLRFWVDIQRGHKTGFYLDQRLNRPRVAELATGQRVLDCFAYSGGFTAHIAAAGAAEVTAVEASQDAIEVGRENLALNGDPIGRVEWISGDVFQVLRGFRDRDRKFDLIVLDPPKFAPTAAQAQKAARGYKDINLLAFKLLRPGGYLATFSCSGGMSSELFQKIVADAALDAGVSAQIIDRLAQSPDHPVALHFPEGAYLKGLICQLG